MAHAKGSSRRPPTEYRMIYKKGSSRKPPVDSEERTLEKYEVPEGLRHSNYETSRD